MSRPAAAPPRRVGAGGGGADTLRYFMFFNGASGRDGAALYTPFVVAAGGYCTVPGDGRTGIACFLKKGFAAGVEGKGGRFRVFVPGVPVGN